jgi:pimeloyl-ACP methyl ester carboxylesterase
MGAKYEQQQNALGSSGAGQIHRAAFRSPVSGMKTQWFLFLMGVSLSLAGCCSVATTSVPELSPGRLLAVGGHNLFVRQSGVGPDVVLLHGLGDSSIGWQFIEPELVQAGYRVTVWDALGAGRSDKPPSGDYSIQAHVRRLNETLDELGVHQAVFVGHSLGGSVALRLAQQNPEKVRALCLIDPAAYRAGAMGGRWFWTTPLLADAVLGLMPASAITDFGLKQNFHNHAAISKELECMYLREAERDGAVAALISQERQLVPSNPEEWEQAHRSIRKPTLIVWGGEDKLVPLAQGTRLAGDIYGSTFVVLADVGHSPHLEAPQMVLPLVLPFLKKVSPE